jgi:nucleolar GTP-binding protein
VLANPEWKHDIVPEILDGKNVADFVDPDILEKLEALEREEEKLEAEGFYASDSDMVRSFEIPALLAECLYDYSLTLTTSAKLSSSKKDSKRRSFRN